MLDAEIFRKKVGLVLWVVLNYFMLLFLLLFPKKTPVDHMSLETFFLFIGSLKSFYGNVLNILSCMYQYVAVL